MSDLAALLVIWIATAWLTTAWLTHVITCFASESWGFLVAGAVFFPVAWAHGTWLWFT